jgi:hypothetical protein
MKTQTEGRYVTWETCQWRRYLRKRVFLSALPGAIILGFAGGLGGFIVGLVLCIPLIPVILIMNGIISYRLWKWEIMLVRQGSTNVWLRYNKLERRLISEGWNVP